MMAIRGHVGQGSGAEDVLVRQGAGLVAELLERGDDLAAPTHRDDAG